MKIIKGRLLLIYQINIRKWRILLTRSGRESKMPGKIVEEKEERGNNAGLIIIKEMICRLRVWLRVLKRYVLGWRKFRIFIIFLCRSVYVKYMGQRVVVRLLFYFILLKCMPKPIKPTKNQQKSKYTTAQVAWPHPAYNP